MASPEPTPGRCAAQTRSVIGYCVRWPAAGQTRCRLHGGGNPQAIAAASRRLEHAAAAQAVRTLGLPREVAPDEALTEELHRTAGAVAWLGEQVATVPADGLYQRYLGTGGVLWERPSVLVELYGVERDRMVKVARSAIDAGLQERQVRVVEHLGEILAAILEGLMGDPELALTDAQRAVAPAVVNRHLALLAGDQA